MSVLTTNAPADLPTLLTISDLSRSFRVSEITIRRMVQRGELQSVRIGHQIRFTRDEVERVFRLTNF